MRTTRVFDVANRLATATGTRARIRRRPEGGYRVEAALPGGLTDEAQLAILAVLAAADRYGHQYSDTAQGVWAEFDEEREFQE
ncbi:hypothetical protein GCM10010193_55530 [Kitasatospora atroaurantiaca]|uniref:Uncharacterized protein n=1 Tax=Kitasatospora atroaurantiaca TaxID=285545 RepID=A0A561EVQ3_9ACTN|nr:hypothetical protein [Kitasatospora atroaurantiaca]TWE19689.1 hypothetical protein FB465_4817 [Kitasatospora atroaurantiaca]